MPMTAIPHRLQRASGECRVAFDLRDGQTRLGDLYQRDPCRVLFPNPELGEPPQAVLLTTSGGVTDGDSLKMAIEIGPSASAVPPRAAAIAPSMSPCAWARGRRWTGCPRRPSSSRARD